MQQWRDVAFRDSLLTLRRQGRSDCQGIWLLWENPGIVNANLPKMTGNARVSDRDVVGKDDELACVVHGIGTEVRTTPTRAHASMNLVKNEGAF